MLHRRRSPLFSAVVLAGASLTQAAACGGESEPAKTGHDASTSDGGSTSDASPAPNVEKDAGSSPGDASCPDGSERPVPPCAYIL